MSNPDLIQSIFLSGELADLIDKVTALNLQRSADICVDTIIYTKRRIKKEGPKDFWLQDIEDCMESYRQLAYCYNYYTGKHLPTVEEMLKDKE